jgi:long-chain acyl-CoA synthetase
MLELFRALVAARPEAAALIAGDSGQITTRAALAARAGELALQLAGAGLRVGDLLAVQLPNSVDFVASFLAALELRLVVIPIDRDAPETEVATILSHFSVRGLIYRFERRFERHFERHAESSLEMGSGMRSETTQISTRQVDSHPALPPEALLVKLTSGSTGMPKGIVASEANLIADCTNICSTMEIRADDLNLGAIPFSHSYGFSNLVTPLILQGTAIVMSNDYLPQSVVDLCNRFRCTVVPAIPMVFDHLTTTARGDFPTVRAFLSAGAPLPAATSRRFRERFGSPIHTFYGCSECGGITYDREGSAVERGTVGHAMHNVRLAIAKERLTVRSASVALGYLHDAMTFRPFDDGTFVTDDLIETAESGEIILTGRASDLINTAGKKVNPREVEQVVLQIEGVREAKVYGEPAGARGEVVAVAVVASPDVTREMVRDFCRQRLSAHKVPRIVKLIEAIPVDDRGKVRRSALALL